MEKIARQLLTVLDYKKCKTDIQISNQLNLSSLDELIKILLFGREKRIFSFERPNKWKLCKRVDQISFDIFCDQIDNEIIISENVIRKYLIVRQSKKSEKRKKKKANNIFMSKSVFHDGKKKLYNGPAGNYWADPKCEKREWE